MMCVTYRYRPCRGSVILGDEPGVLNFCAERPRGHTHQDPPRFVKEHLPRMLTALNRRGGTSRV